MSGLSYFRHFGRGTGNFFVMLQEFRGWGNVFISTAPHASGKKGKISLYQILIHCFSFFSFSIFPKLLDVLTLFWFSVSNQVFYWRECLGRCCILTLLTLTTCSSVTWPLDAVRLYPWQQVRSISGCWCKYFPFFFLYVHSEVIGYHDDRSRPDSDAALTRIVYESQPTTDRWEKWVGTKKMRKAKRREKERRGCHM